MKGKDPAAIERFNQIKARYHTFLNELDIIEKEPIKVFDPLKPRLLEELELIREVSVVLQQKKDEEVKKAAEVAEEDKAKEAQKEETANAEESEEIEKPETEKEN